MSAARMRVESAAGGYDVVIAPGALERLGDELRGVTGPRRAALVTDANTSHLFGSAATSALEGAGFAVVATSVPAGERTKSWERAGQLLEWLAASGMERDDVVVALGGGVVGDLAGFCAAVYMRGVPVVQVPTTLLAQVDSSIGGKTGVDLEGGKNLAGAFHAPVAVVADTALLGSLPEEEWRSGLAEVAKSAILEGEEAVAALEKDARALLSEREEGAVERAVSMAAGLKVRVVSGDERESGQRECLNYGHTLGHAIERVAGYGTVTHGVAVAEGIRLASLVAERVLGADERWTARQEGLLRSLGLPPVERPWEPGDLADAMRADKKVREGVVRFVLTSGPGEWCVSALDRATIEDVLARWRSG